MSASLRMKLLLVVVLALTIVVGCAAREGTISWDGGTYSGEIKNGVPHGRGSWEHPNGNRYFGSWEDGMKHGRGSFSFPTTPYRASLNGDFEYDTYCGVYVGAHTEYKVIDKQLSSSSLPSSGTSRTSCGHDSCAEEGPFYCMGKNDTCNNKTGCAYVFYCSSCR